MFKGVQTFSFKKIRETLQNQRFSYLQSCRRPESNRFKQSQILIERGFEDFITVAVFKKCSNVCRIQTKKLLLSA